MITGCADYGPVGHQDGTGAGTSFYDGDSVTTPDDGELISSDTEGTSFSSGG